MLPYANGYKNAREIFPEWLLMRLQDCYLGRVWVPGKKRKIKEIGKAERDIKMIKLYSEGKRVKDLADEFFLTKERVRQILKGGMKDGSQREDR